MAALLPVRENAKGLVEEISADLRAALPAGMDYDHFKATFVTAVVNNPDILTCDLNSVKNALMKAAIDNLLPDNREAAIVPFFTKVKDKDGKEKSVKMAQYMPMVQGIRKRALELGGARIGAECVHENDYYESEQGDEPFIKHKRAPMNKPRGPVIGAYAIFKDEKSGVIIHREEMDLESLKNVRAVSKSPNSPAWTKFETEMYRKTVIRRGSKSVPSMPPQLRTIIERDDDYVDLEQTGARQRTLEHNPLVDEDRRLPAGNSVPMDRVETRDAKHTVKAKQDTPIGESSSFEAGADGVADLEPGSNQDTDSPSSRESGSPSTSSPKGDQEADRRGTPPPRLSADIFRKYGSSLGRMTSTENVAKAHAAFWQEQGGKPAEGTPDYALAIEILKIHNLRAEGKLDAQAAGEEADAKIDASFGGI